MSGAEAWLVARGVSAGYGKVPVVRDLDLEVHPGEVVALIGPNGAGKTTTLLTLAGSLPLLAGEVRILGLRTSEPLHRRARNGLAFVPEQRAIFRKLSVRDNLRLGLGAVERAVAIAPQLAPLVHRRAGLLSGGEQQILVLARALASDPKVLLADELSLGLAPLVVQRMLGLLRKAADDGAAVLVVEQRLQNILRVADRVCVLRRGQVALVARAEEVQDRFEEITAAYLSGADRPAPPS